MFQCGRFDQVQLHERAPFRVVEMGAGLAALVQLPHTQEMARGHYMISYLYAIGHIYPYIYMIKCDTHTHTHIELIIVTICFIIVIIRFIMILYDNF